MILSNTTPTRWGTLWAAAIVWLLCISFSSAGLFGAPEFDFSSAGQSSRAFLVLLNSLTHHRFYRFCFWHECEILFGESWFHLWSDFCYKQLATWTGGWCWIAFETQGYRVVFHREWTPWEWLNLLSSRLLIVLPPKLVHLRNVALVHSHRLNRALRCALLEDQRSLQRWSSRASSIFDCPTPPGLCFSRKFQDNLRKDLLVTTSGMDDACVPHHLLCSHHSRLDPIGDDSRKFETSTLEKHSLDDLWKPFCNQGRNQRGRLWCKSMFISSLSTEENKIK